MIMAVSSKDTSEFTFKKHLSNLRFSKPLKEFYLPVGPPDRNIVEDTRTVAKIQVREINGGCQLCRLKIYKIEGAECMDAVYEYSRVFDSNKRI